jgi:alkaline phosphatase D
MIWPLIFSLALSATGERIAFGSCSSHKNGKAALWPQLADKSPDHLILLGDNMYADQKITFGKFIGATPQVIKTQYDKLEEDPGFNSVLKKIHGWENVYATWDDHDYGINNGDRFFPYKNESLKHFLEFFHQPLESSLARGGVYSSSLITLPRSDGGGGGSKFLIKIILLDTRYFKDPRGTIDGDFLGETQWHWLEREINDSTVDVILLGSSIQILPTQKIVEESWSVFPHARERLLRLIAHAPCLNIILLSGDVHMAEVSQVSLLLSVSPLAPLIHPTGLMLTSS